MIFLFYGTHSSSSTKECKKWFNTHDLEFKSIKYNEMTQKDLIHILSLTDRGLEDIIVPGERTQIIFKNQLINDTTPLSIVIKCIINFPTILKSPIMLDNNHLQVGYNKDDIRQFISRSQRRLTTHQKQNTHVLD